MARVLHLLCAAIILCHPVFSQPKNGSADSDFSRYYRELVDLGIPVEGSLPEKAIADAIAVHAVALGFRHESYSVTDAHSFHSYSNSLRIIVPGVSPNQVSLIMPLDRGMISEAVPTDPWLNPAMAMAVMDRLKASPPKNTVVIELLGAEDGIASAGLGSRRLIMEPGMAARGFHIYFNWNLPKAGWKIPHGLSGNLSPAWLLRLALDCLDQGGVSLDLRTISSQLHRLGLGLPNPLGPYLSASLPIIEITNVPDSPPVDPIQSAPVMEDALVRMLSSEIPAEAESGMGAWDGNYLVYRLFGRYFIIREFSIVLAFLSGLFLLLVLVYFRRGRRQRYVRAFTRNWGAFLAMTAACLSASLAAGLLVGFFFPDWDQRAAAVAILPTLLVLRLLLSFGIMLTASPLIGRWLSRQSSFLGAAAFMVSVGLLVAISLYNVTLSLYPLGACLFVSLSNLLRWRWAKALFTFLTGICMILPMVEALIQAPNAALDRALLKDPLVGTLVVGLSILPFCFLVCRLWQVIPLRLPRFKRLRIALLAGLFLACFGVLTACRLLVTAASLQPHEISMDLTIPEGPQAPTLVIRGSRVLPTGRIVFRGHAYSIGGGRSTEIRFEMPTPSRPATVVAVEKSTFLDRKTVSLGITSAAVIESCSLNIHSNGLLTVHALNFPFRHLDARSIEVFIGKRPHLPLEVELTIPKDAETRYFGTVTVLEPARLELADGTDRPLVCREQSSFSGAMP